MKHLLHAPSVPLLILGALAGPFSARAGVPAKVAALAGHLRFVSGSRDCPAEVEARSRNGTFALSYAYAGREYPLVSFSAIGEGVVSSRMDTTVSQRKTEFDGVRLVNSGRDCRMRFWVVPSCPAWTELAEMTFPGPGRLELIAQVVPEYARAGAGPLSCVYELSTSLVR